MSTQPLLIEIGVEEIPAGVSTSLLTSLREELNNFFESQGFDLNRPNPRLWTEGCSPRRLLLYWSQCPNNQPDREEVVWGPPEKVAYKDGNPTPAATKFRDKIVAMSPYEPDIRLADKGDGKGNYLRAEVRLVGRSTTNLLSEILPGFLRKLPSPKQMKWNDGETRDDAFIRPIRWIVARLGDEVIPFEFAGVKSGKISRGHRIAGSTGELDIVDPIGWLNGQKVMARREDRIVHINNAMAELCKAEGVEVVADAELVEEVADLTEWPVPVLCEFDADYLRLPEEVIRITLKAHQRCFITHDAADNISNTFIAVANIESKDPARVAEGNARVVNARLADAAFYYDRDPSESLDDRVGKLNNVTFQEGLGMISDQVRRMRAFVQDNARHIRADADAAQRAAYLCKSDLTTGLVYEFPELQGYMGGVYARMDGEPDLVAKAIAEHYQPAGAEDALPSTAEGRVIAIAERIDKLLGYFHLGRIPTASADPFGLRRAAIGLIRLLADPTQPTQLHYNLPLTKVVSEAAKQWNQQRVTVTISDETEKQVYEFITERLMGMASGFNVTKNSIEAALCSSNERPLSKVIEVARVLCGFADTETGQAVAAANKRIANILKKAESNDELRVDETLFVETAEKTLLSAIEQYEWEVTNERTANGEIQTGRHLELLATLREPVDAFFDDVMVMAEDEKVRGNRLALLSRLRTLFLNLADISRL